MLIAKDAKTTTVNLVSQRGEEDLLNKHRDVCVFVVTSALRDVNKGTSIVIVRYMKEVRINPANPA